MSQSPLSLDIENLKLTKKYRIGVIQSLYNRDITDGLVSGIQSRLAGLPSIASNVSLETFHVPGAVEISLVAQKLAEKKQFDALIGCGAIIRGDTFHFECVCQLVTSGFSHVTHHYQIPLIFSVLTCDTHEQAAIRLQPEGPFGHKGYEALDSALLTLATLEQT